MPSAPKERKDKKKQKKVETLKNKIGADFLLRYDMFDNYGAFGNF